MIKKVEEVFKKVERIKSIEFAIVKGKLEVGRLLKELNSICDCGQQVEGKVGHREFQHYMSGIDKFDEFLEELGYSRADARLAMQAWAVLSEIQDRVVWSAISWRRVVALLPVVKSAEESVKLEWLYKAELMPAKGFRDEVKVAKGKIPSDDSEHKHTEGSLFWRWHCCDRWMKINQVELPEGLQSVFEELVKHIADSV